MTFRRHLVAIKMKCLLKMVQFRYILASSSSSVPSLHMENRAGNHAPPVANPASTQELKPIATLSFSTVFLHVSLGLPLLRFPSGAHVRATHGRQLLSLRSTCPIHVHLLFLTSSLMVLVLALLRTSSLDTRIGQ